MFYIFVANKNKRSVIMVKSQSILYSLGFFLLVLMGCRSEEAFTEYFREEDQRQYFKVFGEKDNPNINYPESFAWLFTRYDSINRVRSYAGNNSLVDFRLSSQKFSDEEGNIWVTYPLVDKSKVVGMAVASLEEGRTEVSIDILSSDEKHYHQNINLFQKKLTNILSNEQRTMNSECEINCKYIDEVIIIGSPRKKDGRNSLTVGEDTGGGEWNQPKKCRDFMDCMPFPRYGGGNLPTQPPSQLSSPCEKIKEQRNNSEFTNNIGRLKKNVGLDTETGYIQRTNGAYEYKDNGKYVGNSRSLSLPNLSSNKDIFGYMHTHIDDYNDEDIGIKIFSPSDVIYFLGMLKNAEKEGRDIGDVYAIMVSSEGVYQIRFSESQIGNLKTSYSATETSSLQKDYIRYMRNFVDSNARLELGFLRFLKNKMNIQNVSLYKMNNNGSNTKIKLDSNEKASRDNC